MPIKWLPEQPDSVVETYSTEYLRSLFKNLNMPEFMEYATGPKGPLTCLELLSDPKPGKDPLAGIKTTCCIEVVTALIKLRHLLLGLTQDSAVDFDEFNNTANATPLDFRRIWCRRVALALYVDQHDKTVGKALMDLPRWQQRVLLDFGFRNFGHETKDFSDSEFTQFDNAQDFSLSVGNASLPLPSKLTWNEQVLGLPLQMITVWDPNPLDFYFESRAFFKATGPSTGEDCCHRLAWWMRRCGFAHGTAEFPTDWYQLSPIAAAVAPSPPGAGSCSAKQLIRFKIGGCGINSRYVQKVLRSLNQVAVVLDRAAPFWVNIDPTATEYGGRRAWGTMETAHRGVRCYSAGLSLLHSDDAIAAPNAEPNRARAFANDRVTWIPIEADFYLTQAMTEATPQDYRQELNFAYLYAMGRPPYFGDGAAKRFLPWVQAIFAKGAKSNTATAGGAGDALVWQMLGYLTRPPSMIAETDGSLGEPLPAMPVAPATSPTAPMGLNGRARQTLTRAYSIAMVSLPDQGGGNLVPLSALGQLEADAKTAGLEPPATAWAVQALAAALQLWEALDKKNAFLFSKYRSMLSFRIGQLFRLEEKEIAVSPIGETLSAFALAFPSERTLDPNMIATETRMDPLLRCFFPVNVVSDSVPHTAVTDGQDTRSSQMFVARAIAFAAWSLIWFIWLRDKAYVPGAGAKFKQPFSWIWGFDK